MPPLLAAFLALLFTVACSTLLGSPTAERATQAGAPEGRVVFVGLDGNLYTVGPSGEDRRAVTSDASLADPQDRTVYYEAPTWAPKTRRLAFIRIEGDAGGGSSVRLQAASPEGEVQDLYAGDEAPFYLYWGPDGEQVTFLSSAVGAEDLGLWLVDREGRARTLDRGQPYYWDWAPDGASIFAHVGGSTQENPEGARLSTFSLQTAERKDLEVSPMRFQAPAFSPDGKRVLVAGVSDDPAHGLLVLDDHGTVLEHVASAPRGVAFGWSPAGDRAAFVRAEADAQLGFGELHLVDLAPGVEPVVRPTGLESVAGFFWSPTGLRLAAFVPEFTSEGDDQLISRGRQQERLLLHLHLVDAESGEVSRLTSFRPTEAFLNVLPFYDQYQRSNTIWSPDGSSLAYTAELPSGGSTVFALPAESGSQAEVLGRGKLAFWSWD